MQKNEAGRGTEAQSVTVKSTGCGFDSHSRKWNIYLYFHFSLWCRGKARRWVPPLNTQCLQNLAESGERSVFTLGSLCLPSCVRDIRLFNYLIPHVQHERAELGAGCAVGARAGAPRAAPARRAAGVARRARPHRGAPAAGTHDRQPTREQCLKSKHTLSSTKNIDKY